MLLGNHLLGWPNLLAGATDAAADSGGLEVFLGDDLLSWLILALGGALFVGNIAAIARPRAPEQTVDGELARAPIARSAVMAAIGLVGALWALVTLIA